MFNLWLYANDRKNCPNVLNHRGPEGPCEDIAQCSQCGSISFQLRSAGECFGGHLEDCSLPERHESYCVGGGSGHGKPLVSRG